MKIAKRKALISVTLGVLALVTILIPVINILFSLAALYFAREGVKFSRAQGDRRILSMTFALASIGFFLGTITMLKHIIFMSNFSITIANII